MSVAARVKETVEKIQRNDFEGALYQICSAIDATAQLEYGQTGRKAYQRFIHENLALITRVAFTNRAVLNLRFHFQHPDIDPAPDGLCTFEEIVYHVIRCGLFHKAEMPSNLHFIDEQQLRLKDNELYLSKNLVSGLLLSVVLAPVNQSQKAPTLDLNGPILNLWGFSLYLNCLWGRRNEFTWLLESLAFAPVVDEGDRTQQQSAPEKTG